MRLITRSDFDGLACAVLLEEVGVVDDYLFVHPKDVQDGKVEATENDVVANVPFIEGCGLWFDHHSSERERLEMKSLKFKGSSKPSPSCARVIYDYYGGAAKFAKFDESGLMDAVDRSDSAYWTIDDILQPHGWALLSFVMDARSGLGRFKDYRISNYALMKDMIGYCRQMSLEQILAVPDVEERVKRYRQQEHAYKVMLMKHAHAEANVIVIDLLDLDEIPSGNRFVEYALFPQQNVSARCMWGRERKNVVITVGHSILTRTCNTNVGSLLLAYGGGGHETVGTCQVPVEKGDNAFTEIIETLKKNG
ncbi:MAG TPA: exopolyphosphatase [Myxococcota bacterium]|nr:exopolyphosphatase [Myxococcota bacterium]HRY95385.1 exopolyphosphatase [Myxococcota bacterium]HSA24022.1 exopolyphosphatase [Myxococcota bacterium]